MTRDSRRPADAPADALTGLQVESWRLLWQQLLGDPDALAECREWEARRRRIRPQVLELLDSFLAGTVELEAFRATLDHRTKLDWDAFALKGMSGAMFVNRLVKHVPDVASLSAHLRTALAAPGDADTARERLTELFAYLHDVAAAQPGGVARLQPARAIFFASICWHLYDTETWPGYHLSARRALQREHDLYVPRGDPVADYFAFRAAHLALASALRITSWELEYLAWWRERGSIDDEDESYYEPGAFRTPRAPSTARPRRAAVRERAPTVRAPRAAPSSLAHTHIQWLLARVGRKLGCRVWIAANDHSRAWQGERLATLSVRRLPPLGLDADAQRIVSLIDVVWLRGANEVAAAFEVEHTTSVYSGLLRMADLAALSPNLSFPLYIVAPRERLEKVRRELARPTFRMLKLHRRCAFFSGEALLDASDSIMRWATDPSAIEKLASRADESPNFGDA
ncbi:MAG: hypothetical protein WKG32_08895 [Gemmatimonadaceae bacterium]